MSANTLTQFAFSLRDMPFRHSGCDVSCTEARERTAVRSRASLRVWDSQCYYFLN